MSVKPRHVVAALFQDFPDVPPELSQTPRLVIYDDGLMIVRRDDYGDHQPAVPSYWTGGLTVEELTELATLQIAVLRDPDFTPHYDLSNATDLPTTALVFADGQRAIAISAYGLWIDDFSCGLDSATVNDVPASFLSYHQFLASILRTSRDLSPWKPDSFVALLLPTTEFKSTVPWPTAWPAWKSARVREGGTTAEIVVPVSSRETFWAALPDVEIGSSTTTLGGRNWIVQCYPHFTDDEIWQPLVSAAFQIPSGFPNFWIGPSPERPAKPAFAIKKRRIELETPIVPIRPPTVERPHL